jgi:Na+/H+ antiporter NhaD/arsenite permease-like protein
MTPGDHHIYRLTLLLMALLCLLSAVPNACFAAKTAQEAREGAAARAPTKEDNQHIEEQHAEEHGEIGGRLQLWSCIPFAGILLSIAIFPIIGPRFWHRHYPKVSFFWAVVLALPFLIVFGGNALHEILHIVLVDYIPFIILLWGLFTVSGGIYLKGNLVGRPVVNLAFLIVGAALASWMGTTGAAMLLIRPLIRANRQRRRKVHTVVFFIFLVANIGGSLTPLGDPPLFLGFLHGVPFFWTFAILPHMLVAAVILLGLYFLIDTILYRGDRERIESREQPAERLSIHGTHNFLLLACIMGSVLLSGSWHPGSYSILGVHVNIESTVRDLLIVFIGIVSLVTTRREYREANGFTWFPIKEVAYLFAGIFITIIPPILILRAGSSGSAGFMIDAVSEPFHYFWITGSLSSFLDNAPTYLTFFNLAIGKLSIPAQQVAAILSGSLEHPAAAAFVTNLKAISAGAVFFGAMTYIGNAPNFMVRSIAEESDVRMPSFFGYMLWSVGILAPLFMLITYIFLS